MQVVLALQGALSERVRSLPMCARLSSMQSVALGAAVGLQLLGKVRRVGVEISPVLALRRDPRPRPDPVSPSCTL